MSIEQAHPNSKVDWSEESESIMLHSRYGWPPDEEFSLDRNLRRTAHTVSSFPILLFYWAVRGGEWRGAHSSIWQ